jgi:hypothetical protein
VTGAVGERIYGTEQFRKQFTHVEDAGSPSHCRHHEPFWCLTKTCA